MFIKMNRTRGTWRGASLPAFGLPRIAFGEEAPTGCCSERSEQHSRTASLTEHHWIRWPTNTRVEGDYDDYYDKTMPNSALTVYTRVLLFSEASCAQSSPEALKEHRPFSTLQFHEDWHRIESDEQKLNAICTSHGNLSSMSHHHRF